MTDHSGHRKRLIERLKRGFLVEHEYLEALLFNAIPRRNTNDIAHRLLSKFGSLREIFSVSVEQLQQVEGVGESVASYLYCVGKFCRLFSEVGNIRFPSVYERESFLSFVKGVYGDFGFERLDVYCMDDESHIFEYRTFSDFQSGEIAIDSEAVTEYLSQRKPSGIVLVHNHPASRSPFPSKTDDETTLKFQLICSLQNVLLCDHLIYSDRGIYSYNQSGRLTDLANGTAKPLSYAEGEEDEDE